MDPRAAALAERLGDAGYAVSVEAFAGRASADQWLACYAGLSAAAALLLYPLPLAAALLGIVGIVLHARESDGRPLLRLGSTESVNVVARPPGAAPPDLVVLAGLAPPYRSRSEPAARGLTLCLQVLMVAIPAAGAATWVAGSELPSGAGTAGAGAATAIVVLLLSTYRPPGDGTSEDDPALEVLVALAPALRIGRVWLVGLGAGSDAVQALVDAHPDEVAGAAWLNLAPSASGVVAASEEGSWRERRADRWLMGSAEEAGAEVRPYRFSTYATPLLARRRRALTLLVPDGEEGMRVATATARAAEAAR